MKQFIESVVDSIVQSGLVEVEVSARHVHLTQEDVELLFGKGAVASSETSTVSAGTVFKRRTRDAHRTEREEGTRGSIRTSAESNTGGTFH